LSVICLLVAGAVRATLPGPDFTLAWEHSVQKTRWEETYRLVGDRLSLVEARVEGSGAGMESPPGAQLRDGRWIWQPQSTHAELRLTRSRFTRDYTLCAAGTCADLGDWVGTPAEVGADSEVVSVRTCAEPASAGGEEVRR
jgi:hypothetical protein